MGLFCIASSCLLRVVLHGRLEFLGFLTKPGIFVSADKKKKKIPKFVILSSYGQKKKSSVFPGQNPLCTTVQTLRESGWQVSS